MGTDSCFVVDPGDFSLEIAFGFNADYCINEGKTDPSNFYQLTEDFKFYKGRNISIYSFNGDIQKGTAQLNFTLLHTYTEPKKLTVCSTVKKI